MRHHTGDVRWRFRRFIILDPQGPDSGYAIGGKIKVGANQSGVNFRRSDPVGPHLWRRGSDGTWTGVLAVVPNFKLRGEKEGKGGCANGKGSGQC